MGATTMAEVGIAAAPGARAFFDRESGDAAQGTARCAAGGTPAPHRARCLRATCRCTVRGSPMPALTPDDLRGIDDIERLPFTTKSDLRDGYPFGLFARPGRRTRAPARVVGHDRQADRRRLHARRPRHVGRPDGALVRGGGRPPRRRRAQRVRLRALHRRPGRALRCRAPGRRRRADVRRLDRKAGRADHGLRRAHPVRDAVVCAGHRRGGGAHGRGPPHEPARGRPLRRGAVERRDARRDRGAAADPRRRHLRPVRDHGAGGRLRMRMPRRPARMGGPLPVRGDRPGDRLARCRTGRQASSSSRR